MAWIHHYIGINYLLGLAINLSYILFVPYYLIATH